MNTYFLLEGSLLYFQWNIKTSSRNDGTYLPDYMQSYSARLQQQSLLWWVPQTHVFFSMCYILAWLQIPHRHFHTDIPLFHQFVKQLLGDGTRSSACIRTDSLHIHRSHSLIEIISASITLELLVKKTKGPEKICSNKGNPRQMCSFFKIF